MSFFVVRKVVLLSIIILEPSLLIDNDKNLDDAAVKKIILKYNQTKVFFFE